MKPIKYSTKAHPSSSTGIRNVCFEAKSQKFKVQIQRNRKNHFVGYFSSLEEATEAAIEARAFLDSQAQQRPSK